MSGGLNSDPRRDASPSIRGYVYQAYQSVLAWVRLEPDAVLYLEGAEDFDIHDSSGVTATQVKDTKGSGSVTLRSKDIIEALNNFWSHRNRNKGKAIRFRFLTTAEPGREHGTPFGKLTGLAYWSEAALGNLPIDSLRSFLREQKIDHDLLSFLEEASDAEVREELLEPVHWDTGRRSMDALKALIEDEFINFGNARGVDSIVSGR